MAEPTYDRTNLVEVLAEYKRQATLPPIVLDEAYMRNHAATEIAVTKFAKTLDTTDFLAGEA